MLGPRLRARCARCSRWRPVPAAPRLRRRSPATGWPARPAPRTSSDGGKYVNKYLASFVGFAPVSDPRVIVAVMIDEPSAGKYYGGQVAAPVFARIVGDSLRTLRVPPDAPMAQAVAPAAAVKESM